MQVEGNENMKELQIQHFEKIKRSYSEVYILQMEQVYFPIFFLLTRQWKPKKFEFLAQTPLIITFDCKVL